MLQAKIFEKDKTALNGVTITVPQMAEAVTAFNANANCGLVTFDDYPGCQMVNLERIAGSATLHMENGDVIASIKIHETPMGSIAQQLVDSNCRIYIMPVTSGDIVSEGLKLRIRHLVIPANPATPYGVETPLRQMQAWVTGSKHWPMFELKENK